MGELVILAKAALIFGLPLAFAVHQLRQLKKMKAEKSSVIPDPPNTSEGRQYRQ